MNGRRHLLLVATQCLTMDWFEELDAAATQLYDVLTDEAIGGWSPGLPNGESLLVGTLSKTFITEKVDQAIAHASKCRATLALVFLGHGFLRSNAGTVFLMCDKSVLDEASTAVNLSEFYLGAADSPNVNGVIGLIDACHAGGAAADLGPLSVGKRLGSARLTLLMAAKAGEEAFGFNFSKALVKLLKAGAPGEEDLLTLDTINPLLRKMLNGQGTVEAKFDGALRGSGPLWLAANQAGDVAWSKGVVSPHSAATLKTALERLGSPAPGPGRWDLKALRELGESAQAEPPGPARDRVLGLCQDLANALITTEFVRSWMGAELTPALLNRCVAQLQLRLPRGSSLSRIPEALRGDEQGIIEHFALQRPVSGNGPRSQSLVKLIVTLATAAGKDLADPELVQWAQRLNVQPAMNAAVVEARQDRLLTRLRLVVSLHASITGAWPEALEAWLFDGDAVAAHWVIDNKPVKPSQATVEQALFDAIAEARTRAAQLCPDDGDRPMVQRIDIAVPSALLLRWDPEAITRGKRLGLRYDIRIRWSLRLNPPPELDWVNEDALKRWIALTAQCDRPSVAWLDSAATADVRSLGRALANEVYGLALALDHLPHRDGELLGLLLAYSPIVLWPRAEEGFAAEHRGCLTDSWHLLPEGLLWERREEWRGRPADPIAGLCAVWDDDEWIRLCVSVLRPARR